MFKTDSISQPAPSASGLTRRGIFALAGAGAAIAATPASARTFGSGFTHGVASGEPQAMSVLLWTRYVGEGETRLEWEVSDTAEFTSSVASGQVSASWIARRTPRSSGPRASSSSSGSVG